MMAERGVDIAVADVEGGAALTFTADASRASQLRAMARRMASMHEHHMERRHGMHGEGGMRDGGAGDGGAGTGRGRGGMGKGMMMPASDVTVEDVKDGARVVFTARDHADVERLRASVRQHAERMRAGECPMMQGASAAPEPANPEPAGDAHEGHHPDR